MDEGVGVLDQGVVEEIELGDDLAGVQCDGVETFRVRVLAETEEGISTGAGEDRGEQQGSPAGGADRRGTGAAGVALAETEEAEASATPPDNRLDPPRTGHRGLAGRGRLVALAQTGQKPSGEGIRERAGFGHTGTIVGTTHKENTSLCLVARPGREF
jgi:hypothetical protein